ncbi:cytokine receptor family member B16 [Synchiropus splendidus]|uniref:cytokine receptor family member B16 n=1 Tax=Synchiropus splendidus TaxID=270530 RepID=UPI00237DF05B|nr:cytokine receptor family member B16 [Synchiropus splendidus]
MTLLLLLLHMNFVAAPADIPTLAPPTNVSIMSVNMRHTLRWRPLREPCSTTVLYSVQFQGEFELLVLNGSWVDAHECQVTARTQCDLTFDLGSDSDYNLRVKGRCGPLQSAWGQLDAPFNRRHTLLTPPEVTTTTVGDFLVLKFSQLPLTGNVIVMMWRRGEEQQAEVFTVPVEQKNLHVQLKDQKVHCFRVRTVLGEQLHSSNSETRCVSIKGPDSIWKALTVVTVATLVTAALLFIILWSVIHFKSGSCSWYFHKVVLPNSLRNDWDIIPPEVQEEEELRISMVTTSDPKDTKDWDLPTSGTGVASTGEPPGQTLWHSHT